MYKFSCVCLCLCVFQSYIYYLSQKRNGKKTKEVCIKRKEKKKKRTRRRESARGAQGKRKYAGSRHLIRTRRLITPDTKRYLAKTPLGPRKLALDRKREMLLQRGEKEFVNGKCVTNVKYWPRVILGGARTLPFLSLSIFFSILFLLYL